MKNNRQGARKGARLRALLAAALLTTSATGWASLPSESLSLSSQDYLEQALPATDGALAFEDAAFANAHIAVSQDAWDLASIPTGSYVRPIETKRYSLCRSCEIHLGLGGTYHSFEGTGGMVIPLTVSWDRSRWEFGLFHFSEQTSTDNDKRVERLVARPYWGASLSRRFQFFERGPFKAIFGFGLSYRTEQDILSATHWNFSSQFGLRYQSPGFPAIFELSARHWSNGGIRTPNRGQDFTILTVRFDR